jgi:hypothetical protein
MPRPIAFVALGLIAQAATAQCFEPNFGTALGASSSASGVILPMETIGFAFPLGTATYTDIHISDMGYAFLSNAIVPPIPVNADPSPTAVEVAIRGPRIAALWSNLRVLSTNGGQIHIHRTPTRCVVTWHNMTCANATCAPFDVQMQLFATGQVSVIYSPGAATDPVSVVGISSGFLPPGAISDLSAGGSTTSSFVVEEWLTPNAFDLAGRVLQFVPANPGYGFLQPSACAAATPYGEGCIASRDSVYEALTFPFDLSNTTISWLRSSNGYTMLTSIPGTFVTPSPTAINLAPNMSEGEQVVTLSAPMPVPGGTTNTLNVTTKGQVEFASSPNGGWVDYTPTTHELLAWARTAFHCWLDYNQTAPNSGLILYEEVGGVAYVTWNDVASYVTYYRNKFQFQLDLGTGNVTLVLLAMNGVTHLDPIVIGYSIGGPSFDPGPTDISALTGAAQLFDAQDRGLTLGVNGFPFVGNSTFSFDTSNVPNVVPLAFLLFGDTAINPGTDLTFLGMPGCSGYTNANLSSFAFPVAQPAGTGSVALPIPNNPGLVGAVLSAQSLAFSPLTPLNLASSNGLRTMAGN